MTLPWAAAPALPLIILASGAAACFLVGRGMRERGHVAATVLAVGVLGAAFVVFAALFDPVGRTAEVAPFGEAALRADGLAVLMGLLATGIGFAVAAYTLGHDREERDPGLYTAVFLFLVLGIAGVGLAGDLFNLYVFFEVMALASYALVAYRRDPDASAAGMKYIVMNGAGSIVALTGMGIVYMAAPGGSLDLRVLAATELPPDVGLLAAALLVAGFGVKAAVVPMHTWLPDAYAASPVPVTAMLGGVVTVGGLLAMVKSLSVIRVGGAVPASIGLLLSLLAVLTMTVGNLAAIQQRDLKRMFAYSSVAQVGYMLLGFGAGLEFGAFLAVLGALFHLVNHALMKGGAFLATGLMERAFATRDIGGLSGAARRLPWVGVSLGIFVLGLVGVPPTAGFASKLYIAIGTAGGGFLGALFVVALIANSLLSLAYYVPALAALFSRQFDPGTPRPVGRGQTATVVALAALVIAIGVVPFLALPILEPAVRALLPGGP